MTLGHWFVALVLGAGLVYFIWRMVLAQRDEILQHLHRIRKKCADESVAGLDEDAIKTVIRASLGDSCDADSILAGLKSRWMIEEVDVPKKSAQVDQKGDRAPKLFRISPPRREVHEEVRATHGGAWPEGLASKRATLVRSAKFFGFSFTNIPVRVPQKSKSLDFCWRFFAQGCFCFLL